MYITRIWISRAKSSPDGSCMSHVFVTRLLRSGHGASSSHTFYERPRVTEILRASYTKLRASYAKVTGHKAYMLHLLEAFTDQWCIATISYTSLEKLFELTQIAMQPLRRRRHLADQWPQHEDQEIRKLKSVIKGHTCTFNSTGVPCLTHSIMSHPNLSFDQLWRLEVPFLQLAEGFRDSCRGLPAKLRLAFEVELS